MLRLLPVAVPRLPRLNFVVSCEYITAKAYHPVSNGLIVSFHLHVEDFIIVISQMIRVTAVGTSGIRNTNKDYECTLAEHVCRNSVRLSGDKFTDVISNEFDHDF